uniref:Uncharacterized protein n=1 Tax=Spironucleus salmonicida TaxID=348837 RepID=V6LI60_9EUKA|eukprot:EST44260.1 Hypothetical protein SS50377_15922 [Spironucleus salmonicida]
MEDIQRIKAAANIRGCTTGNTCCVIKQWTDCDGIDHSKCNRYAEKYYASCDQISSSTLKPYKILINVLLVINKMQCNTGSSFEVIYFLKFYGYSVSIRQKQTAKQILMVLLDGENAQSIVHVKRIVNVHITLYRVQRCALSARIVFHESNYWKICDKQWMYWSDSWCLIQP